MNKETKGHTNLKNTIKARLRPVYGRVRFFTKKILSSSLCRKTRALISPQSIQESAIRFLGMPNSHVSFGYYDVTPFSRDDRLLLAHTTRNILCSDVSAERMEVGYYRLDEENPVFQSLRDTNTWCWQQGCRLQWLPEEKGKIIFNRSVAGNYGSVILDATTGQTEREIPHPVYSVAPDGKRALSLDFSRLQRLRPGYGYSVFPEKNRNDPAPDGNGITLVDLLSGKSELLVSLRQVSEIAPNESMAGAEHYFNHIMFNPVGDRFLFLHLWMQNGRRFSRLFTSDITGSELRLLNNSGMVSHYNWIDMDKIVLFSRLPSGDSCYAIFQDTKESENPTPLRGAPETDGHPTLIFHNRFMITDTYPDRFSQRSLLLCDLAREKTIVLARFDSPDLFARDVRCDLHPRVSNSARLVCVDTVVGGNRAIALLDLRPEYFEWK